MVMTFDLALLAAIVAACVSCGAAVFAVLFIRRGSDAELKADVEELTLLVERQGKTQRRERLAHVRAQRRAGADNDGTGASETALVGQAPSPDRPLSAKEQLRLAYGARLRGGQ